MIPISNNEPTGGTGAPVSNTAPPTSTVTVTPAKPSFIKKYGLYAVGLLIVIGAAILFLHK